MAFDEAVAARVRKLFPRRQGATEKTEKKMFGGIGFLLDGNMCCGVWKEFLILRVGLDAYNEYLREPFVREFDITGRPMRGWVMVHPEGFAEDDTLRSHVQQAVRFVSTLPAKIS